MAVLERIQEKKFLGMEFVTWLWYRSEQGNGSLPTPDGGLCHLEFEKDLVLSGEAGEATASTLKGETPTMAPEAGTSLAAGKKVKRAKLTVTSGDLNYELTMNAETFDFGSLKVEVPPSLPFAESIPLRLGALDQFEALFSSLFRQFADMRLDEGEWRKEAGQIRDWVEAKIRGRDDME